MRHSPLIPLTLCAALIGCGKPTPPPTPPPPIPEPLPAHAVTVVIVTDPTTETPDAAAIYTDPGFRAWMHTAGNHLRVVTASTTDETGGTPVDLAPYLAAAEGKPSPWLAVGDAGRVLLDAPLPADPATLQRLVSNAADKATVQAPPQFFDGCRYRPLGLRPPKPGAAARWPKYGERKDSPIIPRKDWRDCDFSHLVPGILDQDGQSSCCPCSATGAYRTAAARTGLQPDELSVGDLYYRINGGRDAGATLEDALTELTTNGVTDTAHASLFAVTKRQVLHKPGWELDRTRHKVLLAEYCETLDHVASALQRRRPVVYGTLLTSAFQPDDNATIGPKRGRGAGGHAMYLAGLRKGKDGWYLLTINSWGERWGDNGKAWLHESWLLTDYFAAWCISSIVCPTDDKCAQTPPPRSTPTPFDAVSTLLPKMAATESLRLCANDPLRYFRPPLFTQTSTFSICPSNSFHVERATSLHPTCQSCEPCPQSSMTRDSSRTACPSCERTPMNSDSSRPADSNSHNTPAASGTNGRMTNGADTSCPGRSAPTDPPTSGRSASTSPPDVAAPASTAYANTYTTARHNTSRKFACAARRIWRPRTFGRPSAFRFSPGTRHRTHAAAV